MKKAIFRKFVWIILLALLASNLVFCLMMGGRNLRQTEEDLLDRLYMIDYALDYTGMWSRRSRKSAPSRATRISV